MLLVVLSELEELRPNDYMREKCKKHGFFSVNNKLDNDIHDKNKERIFNKDSTFIVG